MIKGLLITLLIFNALITSARAEKNSIECLAKNIYFEAKNQSFAGKIAIAFVVMNRVKDKRFPNTICKVIYESPMKESWKTRNLKNLPASQRIYYPVRNKCQFSWYCDGKADTIKEKSVYADIIKIVKIFLDTKIEFIDFTEGSTHYHAFYVSPDWGSDHTKTFQIDDHIFYRWETSK